MDYKTHIALFASGGGSNAEVLMRYFERHPKIKIALVITNVENAGVVAKAEKAGVPTVFIPKKEFNDAGKVLKILSDFRINFIVLAGFLQLIPLYLIEAFNKRIVNIHPALLPAFGGKGMYGMNVHTAVAVAKVKHTGITIHHCNAHYDEGGIVFQATCPVKETDTPEEIAKNVLTLEHHWYAPTVERLILQTF